MDDKFKKGFIPSKIDESRADGESYSIAQTLMERIMTNGPTQTDVQLLAKCVSEIPAEKGTLLLSYEDFVDRTMKLLMDTAENGPDDVLECALILYQLSVTRVEEKAIKYIGLPDIVHALNACLNPNRGSRIIRSALWCMAYGSYEANRRETPIFYDLSFEWCMRITETFPELTVDIVRLADLFLVGAPLSHPYVMDIMKTWLIKYSPLYNPKPIFEFLLNYITDCSVDDTIFEGLIETGFLQKTKDYVNPCERMRKRTGTKKGITLQTYSLQLIQLVLQKNQAIVDRMHEFVFPEEILSVASNLGNDPIVISEALKLLQIVSATAKSKSDFSWIIPTLFSCGVVNTLQLCLQEGSYAVRVSAVRLLEELVSERPEHSELRSDEFLDCVIEMIDTDGGSLAEAAISCTTQILECRAMCGNLDPTPLLLQFREELDTIIDTSGTRMSHLASRLSTQMSKMAALCV